MFIDYYTEEELSIAKEIIFTVNIGVHSLYQANPPVGILLGGQPASGKTGLIKQVRRAYQDRKFVVINGDEYRQYHPRARKISEEYGQDAPKYTQPFSNALVEYLKAECLRLRCNFIIEGTMRTYAVIERTAQEVKQSGFRCEAHALAVHRQDSLLGYFSDSRAISNVRAWVVFRPSTYTTKLTARFPLIWPKRMPKSSSTA